MGCVVLSDHNLRLIFIRYTVYSCGKIITLYTHVCPSARQETLCEQRQADSMSQGNCHLCAPPTYASHNPIPCHIFPVLKAMLRLTLPGTLPLSAVSAPHGHPGRRAGPGRAQGPVHRGLPADAGYTRPLTW